MKVEDRCIFCAQTSTPQTTDSPQIGRRHDQDMTISDRTNNVPRRTHSPITLQEMVSAMLAGVAGLGAMYLDAKYLLHFDLRGIGSVVRATIKYDRQDLWVICKVDRYSLRRRTEKERLNNFYLLEELASARPNDIFLIFQGCEYTYKQSYNNAMRWSNYFISLGVQKKDIVALNFMNKPAFLFATLGLWAIGALPAFINYNLAEASLLHCIKISTAKIMVYDEEIEKNVDTVRQDLTQSGIRAVCYRDDNMQVSQHEFIDDIIIGQQDTSRPSDSCRSGAVPTDPAVLIYTSGSTGLPKAAIVTWTKFAYNAKLSSSVLRITEKDRFYTCMPVYHGTATVLGLGTCLVSGATLVLGKKFSNKTFWEEVRSSKATIIQYVGEVCRYLMSTPPSPLDTQHFVRMAYGNGMRPDVWENFRTRFGINTIAEFYASTEGVGGSMNYNTGSFGAGAVGRSGVLANLLQARPLCIKVNLDTCLEERTSSGLCIVCGNNEPGEVVYPLDTTNPAKTFAGYFNNPKATASKLIHNVQKKGDVFLRMGDLMSYDDDGFTYFHDRLGDSFRWKGENVSTTEVSEAIGAFPGILEANVYGVQLPNHDGRAGCAALSKDPSAPLDLQALAKHVSKVLPRYAVPQFVRLAQKMEVTGNHKHQKVGMREQGVDPRKVGQDTLYWLKNDHYVPFTDNDWQALVGGRSRL